MPAGACTRATQHGSTPISQQPPLLSCRAAHPSSSFLLTAALAAGQTAEPLTPPTARRLPPPLPPPTAAPLPPLLIPHTAVHRWPRAFRSKNSPAGQVLRDRRPCPQNRSGGVSHRRPGLPVRPRCRCGLGAGPAPLLSRPVQSGRSTAAADPPRTRRQRSMPPPLWAVAAAAGACSG